MRRLIYFATLVFAGVLLVEARPVRADSAALDITPKQVQVPVLTYWTNFVTFGPPKAIWTRGTLHARNLTHSPDEEWQADFTLPQPQASPGQAIFTVPIVTDGTYVCWIVDKGSNAPPIGGNWELTTAMETATYYLY